MEYLFNEFISKHHEMDNNNSGDGTSSNSSKMSRETVEPLFSKQRRPGPIIPSVMVLPRINNEQSSSTSDQASLQMTRSFADNKTASESIFKSMIHPAKSNDDVNIKNELSEHGNKGSTDNVRRRRSSITSVQNASRNVNVNKNDASLPPRSRASNSKENKDYKQRITKGTRNIKKFIPSEQSRDFLNESKAFEDQSRRDLWHYSRPTQPVIYRRGSVCSSCGGAMSSAISISTRRFSTLSLDVASENQDIDEGRNESYDQSLLQNDENRQTSLKSKKINDLSAQEKDFQRIQREKNLLYELISVLYKKNFIKEEIKPYVRHALEICHDK